MAHGLLVLRPGIEPGPPALGMWSVATGPPGETLNLLLSLLFLILYMYVCELP